MNKEEAIYLSIYPKHTKRIEDGSKNCEFRNFKPKKDIKYLYVYETSPSKAIKYVLELKDIVAYPDKLEENGKNNDLFNKGDWAKYAYRIKKVYKLKNSISLDTLKNEYNFNAPQGYMYSNTYPRLTSYIKNCEKELIIKNN